MTSVIRCSSIASRVSSLTGRGDDWENGNIGWLDVIGAPRRHSDRWIGVVSPPNVADDERHYEDSEGSDSLNKRHRSLLQPLFESFECGSSPS